MSEAPGPALGPETTLETATNPATTTDRREELAAALDALEPAQATETAPIAADPAASVVDTATPAATPEPWDTPPPSWKKEQHAHWAGASPELRQYMHQRENEMRQGIEAVIPKAKFADEVNGVIGRYQQNLQAAGVPPVAAIQTLMEADNILRNAPPEQKAAYARQLLQQYGVDLGDGSYVPVDPTIAALRNELTEVRGTVQTWQQQQQQASEQAMQSEIAGFASNHEHFETLRPTMARLMTGGLAQSLDEAYQQALRLDENLFSAQQAGQQAAAEAEKKEAADKAAKAARAAAVSVRTSTPGGPSATKAQDRRATLESQFDALSARL